MSNAFITTLTDLQNFVRDRMGDAGTDDVLAVTDALQSANHPAWGSDWSEWLADEMPRAVASVGC